MKDLHNNIKRVRVISPISPAATGTISGQPVDLTGYQGCEFLIDAGAQTTTGITVTPVVKAGAATGSMAAAADADLLGTEAAAALDGTAGANSGSKIGYKGIAKYATVDLAVAGAATGTYSVVAVLSGPRKAPVA